MTESVEVFLKECLKKFQKKIPEEIPKERFGGFPLGIIVSIPISILSRIYAAIPRTSSEENFLEVIEVTVDKS